MAVHIEPLPPWMRKIRFRPNPSPCFVDGPPSAAEVELAIALYAELDAESRAWYGLGFPERLRARWPTALR